MALQLTVRFVADLAEAALLLPHALLPLPCRLVLLGVQVEPGPQALPPLSPSLVAERRGAGPALEADRRPHLKLGEGGPRVLETRVQLDKGFPQQPLLVLLYGLRDGAAQAPVLALELVQPGQGLVERPDVTVEAFSDLKNVAASSVPVRVPTGAKDALHSGLHFLSFTL